MGKNVESRKKKAKSAKRIMDKKEKTNNKSVFIRKRNGNKTREGGKGEKQG